MTKMTKMKWLGRNIGPLWFLFVCLFGFAVVFYKTCTGETQQDEFRVVKNKVERLDKDVDELKEQVKQCRSKEAK